MAKTIFNKEYFDGHYLIPSWLFKLLRRIKKKKL